MSDDVKVQFGVANEEAISALNQVRFAIEGLTDPLRAVRSTLGEVGEAFVAAFAVEQIVEFTEKMAELGLETEKMAAILGMTTKEVGEFQYIAGSVGISGESAALALERLSRSLSETSKAGSPAQQAMAALHITYKDAITGAILPLNELLPQIANKFQMMADGPNKTALAMDMFGRAGAQMIPILDKGAAGLKELSDAADSAGVALDDQATTALASIHEALYKLGQEIHGVTIQAFLDLAPVILGVVDKFQDLYEWSKKVYEQGFGLHDLWLDIQTEFDQTSDAVERLLGDFKKLGDELGVQDAKLPSVKETWKELQFILYYTDAIIISLIGDLRTILEWAITFGKEAGGAFLGVADILGDVATGHFGQATKDWETMMERWEQAARDHATNIKNIWLDTQRELAHLGKTPEDLPGFITPKSPSAALPDFKLQNAPGVHPLNEGQKAAEEAIKAEEKVAQARIKLEQEVDNTAYAMGAESLNAHLQKELDTAQEAYEAKRSALVKLQALYAGDKDKQAEYTGQLRSLDAEYMTQKQALWDKYYQKRQADAERDTQREVTNLERELQEGLRAYDRDYQMHLITIEQKTQLETAFTNFIRKQIIDRLTAAQAGLDKESEQYKKLEQQKEQVTQQSNARIDKLNDQLVEFEVHRWQQLGTAISRSFGNALSGMLNGTMTWRQAMINVISSITDAFINMGVEIVDDWIKQQIAKLIVTKTSETAAGVTQIMTAAAIAAANAFASTAAIPIVGPELAPAAAASAYGTVSAMTSLLSAAGGMVVPHDTLAMVHEDEMILPAHLSSGVQNIIANNGGGGGGGGGDTYNVHIHAMDGQSVARVLSNNEGALVSAFAKARRNMHPALMGAGKSG